MFAKLPTLHGPYARHDIARILDPLGSRFETFLRATVLPASSRKDTLKDLINTLAPAGLPQPQVDALDRLRSLYNRSKHRQSEGLPLGEVIDAVQRAAGAISCLIALGVETVQVPYEREISRTHDRWRLDPAFKAPGQLDVVPTASSRAHTFP